MMANSSPLNRATRSPSRTNADKTLGDVQNQTVAHRMAETVVDRLKAIEVEKEDGKFCIRRAASIFAKEILGFDKKIAVRQLR